MYCVLRMSIMSETASLTGAFLQAATNFCPKMCRRILSADAQFPSNHFLPPELQTHHTRLCMISKHPSESLVILELLKQRR